MYEISLFLHMLAWEYAIHIIRTHSIIQDCTSSLCVTNNKTTVTTTTKTTTTTGIISTTTTLFQGCYRLTNETSLLHRETSRNSLANLYIRAGPSLQYCRCDLDT